MGSTLKSKVVRGELVEVVEASSGFLAEQGMSLLWEVPQKKVLLT